MKLRIHKNSLRLRLNRLDVEQIRKTGICSETLRFGAGAQLTYTLETSSQFMLMKAEYCEDRLRVQVPQYIARQWADSDQVSLSRDGEAGGGPSLLIEKDFQCLHCESRKPGEDAEAFPNPLAERQCATSLTDPTRN